MLEDILAFAVCRVDLCLAVWHLWILPYNFMAL